MNTNAKFRLALGYVTSYTGLNFDNFIWARLSEVILVSGKFIFAHTVERITIDPRIPGWNNAFPNGPLPLRLITIAPIFAAQNLSNPRLIQARKLAPSHTVEWIFLQKLLHRLERIRILFIYWFNFITVLFVCFTFRTISNNFPREEIGLTKEILLEDKKFR